MATVHPPKQRRTGYRPTPIVEGSDMSLDTALYIQSEGGERILVPVRPEMPDQEIGPGPEPDPFTEPDILHDYQQPADIDMITMTQYVLQKGIDGFI